MAKNGQKGKGREGMIDKRSQVFNPLTKLWIKRNTDTGEFMDNKTSGGKFKGIKKEK